MVVQADRDVAAAMAAPEVRARMAEAGIEPVGGTPDALREPMAREIPRMAGVLGRAGVRPE